MYRILIVDDHRNTRDALAIGLALFGCAADTAASADEALRLAEEHPYNLVVCDIRMPGCDGLELGSQLRRRFPQLNVALMTAYELEGADNRRFIELGVPLLIKPVTAEALNGLCRAGAPIES